MSKNSRSNAKSTAIVLVFVVAGGMQGYMFGYESARYDLTERFNERTEWCDEYVDRYESQHALITDNSAYFRLKERTRTLYRISEAADYDLSYETLMLDIGSGYRDLLERANTNMPEDLHKNDAIYMELARSMADQLRNMAEERAARDAASGS